MPSSERPHVELPGPALDDYDAVRSRFTWEQARSDLGLDPERTNIAEVALTRHLTAGRGERVALRCIDRLGAVSEVTYAELADQAGRFASVLHALGVRAGERVFTLLGRVPELHVTMLGALQHGAVVAPLFSAFGPEPVLERMRLGDARVLVTTGALYRRKVAPVRDQVPGLAHVLVLDPEPGDDVLDLRALLDSAVARTDVAPTAEADPALLHFTSGTTGHPKGAVHVHGAVVAHHATAAWCLDLHPDDVYWCTADPGWVTGVSYGVIAPLTHGVTCVLDAREFDPEAWYSVLEEQAVTVWYTAPTALRMLMKHGGSPVEEHDLSALRHVASVGEPLNPEVVVWSTDAFGLTAHDTWWQTETGAIMVSNYRSMPVRPGSMGRPVPGVDVAVLACDEDGRALLDGGRARTVAAGEVGVLALRAGWPSMFQAYLGEPERYAACFADGWYLSGDLAQQDEDGYVWFVGRADDVIKSAGHLIGPFEVESVLMEHPAVAEAGVIGKPDEIAGQLVKAFVTLKQGHDPDEVARRELLTFCRKRLGAVAPKEIEFQPHLPHTSSGKIMRRLLKAHELGLPEGDLSTLEPAR